MLSAFVNESDGRSAMPVEGIEINVDELRMMAIPPVLAA